MNETMRLQKPHENAKEPQAGRGVHSKVREYLHDRTIDLGCGRGLFNAGAHVDIFPKKNLRNFCKLDLSCDKLPFRSKSFDVAILVEVLEHLENPWFAVREAKRVAKRVIITTPSTGNLRNKLIFLFRGRFYLFGHKTDEYHITPLFNFQLKRMRGTWMLTYQTEISDVLIQAWDEEESGDEK